MIKIAANRQKQKQKYQKMMQLKYKRITQQLSEYSYDISDSNCIFQIFPKICLKNNFIAIQLKVRPHVGLFQKIDFTISVFLEQNNIKSPKIYNDRRIFHQNINPYTFEIAVPEAINWNPTYTLIQLFRRLKYTLVQPNNITIPNNKWNRQAAYLYKINRENYRDYIIQYSPAVLDNIINKQYKSTNKNTNKYIKTWDQQNKQDSYSCMQNQIQPKIKKYVQLNDIMPTTSRVKQYEQKQTQQDMQQFLNKRMSRMKIDEVLVPCKSSRLKMNSDDSHNEATEEKMDWLIDLQ